jgi:hypothetical protein
LGDGCFEIRDEGSWVDELVGLFSSFNVPMIAFASFIVISNQSLADAAEEEAILEEVPAAEDRLGHSPDHHLADRSIGGFVLLMENPNRIQVGNHANTCNPRQTPSVPRIRSHIRREPPERRLPGLGACAGTGSGRRCFVPVSIQGAAFPCFGRGRPAKES